MSNKIVKLSKKHLNPILIVPNMIHPYIRSQNDGRM